jgi:hypothetical protein
MRVCLVAVAAATLTVSACGAGASFPVYPTIPEASAPHAGQPAAEPSSAPPQRALDSVLRSVQPDPARLPHTMPDPQPRPPQRSVVAAELPPHRSSAPEWRCDEWVDTAVAVGWPEEQLPKLSYAVYRESRCDPDAHNTDDPTRIGSLGLIQINGFWCLPSQYWPDGWLQTHGILDDCDELFDPETNLLAALAIWENSGWGPWNL